MSKARRWLVLVTVSAGLLLISVDMTVLYTALPTLTADLGADASEKLWIINAYPLVMAGLLLGAGTLGDRIGHKRMFVTGLAVFGAASVAAATAPSPEVLIAARAVLAVGAAAMMPATLALIRVTFDDARERGVAIGVWGTVAVVGTALGPIVGGLLLERFWWGSVFLINLPVVVLALAAALVFAPGGRGRRDRPWDAIASLQVMVGLVGLVYAIKETVTPDPAWAHGAVALLISAAGFGAFARRQRGRPYPLIDFSLFRSRRLVTGVLAAGLSMFATAGIQLVLAQRLQLVMELTPLRAGLLVAGLALGALPAGVVAGGLVHRIGLRPLIGGGLLLGAFGVLAALLLTPGAPGVVSEDAASAWIVPGLVVTGASLGVVMTAASIAIIGGAPPHRAGMASSVEEVSFEFGNVTGVAVLGSLLTAVYGATVDLPGGAPAAAGDSLDDAHAVAATLPEGQAHGLLGSAADAFDNGYVLTLALVVALLTAGGLAVFRYLERDRPAAPGAAPAAAPAEPAESAAH